MTRFFYVVSIIVSVLFSSTAFAESPVLCRDITLSVKSGVSEVIPVVNEPIVAHRGDRVVAVVFCPVNASREDASRVKSLDDLGTGEVLPPVFSYPKKVVQDRTWRTRFTFEVPQDYELDTDLVLRFDAGNNNIVRGIVKVRDRFARELAVTAVDTRVTGLGQTVASHKQASDDWNTRQDAEIAKKADKGDGGRVRIEGLGLLSYSSASSGSYSSTPMWGGAVALSYRFADRDQSGFVASLQLGVVAGSKLVNPLQNGTTLYQASPVSAQGYSAGLGGGYDFVLGQTSLLLGGVLSPTFESWSPGTYAYLPQNGWASPGGRSFTLNLAADVAFRVYFTKIRNVWVVIDGQPGFNMIPRPSLAASADDSIDFGIRAGIGIGATL